MLTAPEFGFYKLVGREVVACAPHEWIGHSPSRIALDESIRDVMVSTIFLGIGGPALFETMIRLRFYGFATYQVRTTTLDRAEAIHALTVDLVWEGVERLGLRQTGGRTKRIANNWLLGTWIDLHARWYE